METVTEIAFSRGIQSRIFSGETLAGAAELISGEREWFLVYDTSVISTERSEWRDLLPAPKGHFALTASEAGKTMETVMQLCRAMMEAGLSRDGLVVALGGGITSDLAGFAASIYKRGVRYAVIPTTHLSQVDASIGGKTGVNVDTYKNMLGVISLPQWVYLCPEVLSTLPEREFRCGLAELLKTFLVADADLYADAVSRHSTACPAPAADYRHSTACPWNLVLSAARIKAGIVSRDLTEQGERRKLNFGHTFAHAIESVAQQRGDDIRHGEAVAMGIILAARLSDALGVSRGLESKLASDFAACALPVECPYPPEALVDAMTRDKKAESDGRIRFILLPQPGETVEQMLSPEQLLPLITE